MAKTQPKTLERTYNIPLRKEYMKAPRWKRTKKAMNALREFLVKHMKSPTVKLGKELNQKMWQHGIRNPPHHIKVTALKDEKGVVMANLFGIEAPKKEQKLAKEKPKQEAKTEQVATEPAEKKSTQNAEEKHAQKESAEQQE